MHSDDLPIPEPCHVDWAQMTGDEQRRFCASCTKHVHDLSAMTERQAERVLETVDEPCVRYAVDDTGALVFTSRRRALRRALMAAALAIATPAAAGAVPSDGGDSLLERITSTVREWMYGVEGCQLPPEPPPEPPAVAAAEAPAELPIAEVPSAETGLHPLVPIAEVVAPKPQTARTMGRIALPRMIQGAVAPVAPSARTTIAR